MNVRRALTALCLPAWLAASGCGPTLEAALSPLNDSRSSRNWDRWPREKVMAAAENAPDHALVSRAFYQYATPEDVKQAVNGRSLKGWSQSYFRVSVDTPHRDFFTGPVLPLPTAVSPYVLAFHPLEEACAYGGTDDPEVVRVLLDAGCEAEGRAEDYARTKFIERFKEEARPKGNPAIFEMLLRAAPVAEPCGFCFYLASMGQATYLRTMLDLAEPEMDLNTCRDHDNQTLLMRAAYYGDPETVRLLLGAGADPSLTDKNGKTAAGLAFYEGRDPKRASAIRRLLAAGPAPKASPNPKKP
jgi:hypothetical protein